VLRVDGGMVASDWTMQFLADILGAPVDRPEVLETTALGAAWLARAPGMQAGVYPVEAEDDPFIAACRNLAARHGIWIHAGSTPVLAPDGRFLNHSAVIDAAGAIRATYDKVHLFDVAIEGQAPDRRVQALRTRARRP
jgi:hypothetical protein